MVCFFGLSLQVIAHMEMKVLHHYWEKTTRFCVGWQIRCVFL